MRATIAMLCPLLAAVTGCFQTQTASPNGPQAEGRTAWPKDWSPHLGQTVTVEGTAGNAKLGAVLQGAEGIIWIDGLEQWPEGFYTGDARSKRLRVTGTVIERDDMPAFIGDSSRAGIPVQSEKELAQANRRFLLKDAKWTVLD
jgi:hypothetical protein